jgi:hypothetical protein
MRKTHLALAVLVAVPLVAARRAGADEPPLPPPSSSAPPAPPPARPVVEGRILHLPSAPPFDVGCEGRAVAQQGDRVFVACGADGVVEIDASNPQALRRSGRMPLDSGEATGLFVRDGRVWVEIAHVVARPVRIQQDAAEAPAPAPAPREPEPPASAEPHPTHASLLAPPRHGGLWELSATAGGFVNLGPVGGGGFGSASAVYRLDLPIVIRAEVSPGVVGFENNTVTTRGPSGFAVATQQTATSSAVIGAAQVLVGLDTQFVEVALGAGASSISRNFTTNAQTGGPAIVEEGRFGARDGLALTVEASTVAANNQFSFGFFEMDLQVPTSRSFMLIARGGGGNVGLLFGDLGVRYLIQGDGGPDTIAIKGFFGGAGIEYQSACNNYSLGPTASGCTYISVGGPTVGGGVEWRR